MEMKKQTHFIETDILVIGSGIAGLTFALKASQLNPSLSILIISKSEIEFTNTRLAQGGIAVVSDFERDSFEKHIQDTLKAGKYASIEEVVEMVVRQAPSEIQWLEEIGIQFTKNESGENELGLEGGHSEARIVHHNDQTGKAVQEILIQQLVQATNVRFESNQFVSKLITSTDKQKCIGAKVISIESGETKIIASKATYLATGGCGQLFECTTNPEIATGDGVALAITIGAKVENMDSIQFHPTSFYEPSKTTSFLISEAVRGFGAYLINDLGERFLFKTDERGELATRDIVSQAIYQELSARKSQAVYLDLRHLVSDQFKAHFPSIHQFLAEKGIDVSKDLIPVVPAAHYQCGGVSVDIHGETSILNLFAGGECANTGLHGKNRLASNSLLEALVYADLSSKKIKERLEFRKEFKNLNNSVSGDFTPDNKIQTEIKQILKQILTHQVISIDCKIHLNKSLKKLKEIQQYIKEEIATEELNPTWLELKNIAQIGQQIVQDKFNSISRPVPENILTKNRTILSE
jgi:L-aspartate oxidase